MRIRTQLRIAALLPVLIAVVSGGALWLAAAEIDHARANAVLAEKASRFNFELNILTQEYLLFGGARTESQLLLRLEAMKDLLAQMEFAEPEQQQVLDGLRQDHEAVERILRLLTTSQTAGRNQIAGALLVKFQDARAKARQLDEVENLQVIRFQRRADLVVLMTAATFAALSALLLGVMAKRITSGLDRLDDGMRRIASGDLSHHLTSDRDDELAALARSFNEMSRQLHDSYTSIDRLTDEIAQRKQAETELLAASLYARNLIEASLDPLVTISATGQITDVNEATVRATGIDRQRLVGSDFSDYFTEPEMARAGYQQVFANGFVRDFPLTLQHASGRRMDVLYNASTYRNEKGEVAGVFAAARDITERKHAEEEIRRLNADLEQRVVERTASLEAANKDLEAFAYSVSHDLRAPLRAFVGFSRKVVKDSGERLDEEGRRQLKVVRDNCQRMGRLIDDLLAFSRMGRREIALQAVDMDAMARGVVDELRTGEPQRAAEFATMPLPAARGDNAMLRQVWTNLIGNAFKFTSRRPVAHIEIGGREEDGEVIYWVKDDGAGFDMQYADKLFGVFQRLHRQDEFEGTGVGLATAQRILHRHGGRIWAEARPDAGACFWFALPMPSAGDDSSGEERR